MSYSLSTGQAIGLTLLVIWELVWKGLALWRAAKINQAYWFTAILVLNTAGILPIIYLLLTNNRKKAIDDGASR